jgi:hypothetical protein
LPDAESLTIRPARALQDAPKGDARANAFERYQQNLDMLADRVREIAEAEIETALNEALSAGRHSQE